MDAGRFEALTLDQERLLTAGGWPATDGSQASRPSRKTAAELVARGLMLESEAARRDAHGEYSVMEYIVPASVHRQWLSHLEARESRYGDAA